MNVRSEMHNIDSKSNCRDYLSTDLHLPFLFNHPGVFSILGLFFIRIGGWALDRNLRKVFVLKAKVSVLQNQVIKAKKKIAEENIQKAVKVAIETAEVAASDGKAFCISRVNVGLDTTTMREAVVKVMDEKGIAVMVFSTDETANKALVYAGVPEKGDKCKQLKVLEWLVAALKPLKGKGGGGKGGLAQGQVLTILVIENLERNVDSMVWVLKSCTSLALRLIYVLQDLYFLVV
ncbi:alanine--tRNA ligase-like [Camellia sinensis]|uniref:alanine--tRNA ligase-like n=1 Tax=Camellia sinensis TaxID=4442 RepID=UPI0010365523|nr:alanine--tRNA ligase-like [Camellia sinensis]